MSAGQTSDTTSSVKTFNVLTQTELRELQQDRLLSYILDQRDLWIEFVHLVSKRLLPKVSQKCAASSA
ncbi:hypothetical protein PC128_g26495 [Phytophthora cactorum]|nr:hypothetical protein PC128_g26495 [Phytophthora cactorum]